MSNFQFGAGAIYATQTIDASGVAVALAQPLQLGTLQEVALDISFDSKELYGASQFPLAVGRGKGKITGKAKVAAIDGRILSDLVFGRAAAVSMLGVMPNEAHAVASTITLVPPSAGVFSKDLGVINAATGVPLVRVAAAPAAGQYAVIQATGEYDFALADVGNAVLISYEFTKATGGTTLTLNNELMGVAPFFAFELRNAYQGKEIVLKLNRVTASKFSMPFKNDDFVVPDLEFQAMQDDAGQLGTISFR